MSSNKVDHYNGILDSARVKPQCQQCYSHEHVSMIDVLLDPSDSQGTTPMWRCSSCSKTWTGRTSEVDSILNNNTRPSVNYPSYDFKRAISQAVDPHNNPSLSSFVEDKIRFQLQRVEDNYLVNYKNLEKRVEVAEEVANNPIAILRRTVTAFNLE